MNRDESLPLGTVTPEQVREAKAAAAALDLAAIEARINNPDPGQGDYDGVCERMEQAEADRAALFATLQEREEELQRLRAAATRYMGTTWDLTVLRPPTAGDYARCVEAYKGLWGALGRPIIRLEATGALTVKTPDAAANPPGDRGGGT